MRTAILLESLYREGRGELARYEGANGAHFRWEDVV